MLLLDEMISPSLAPRFADIQIDAVPLRDRGMLSSSDYEVWKYAQSESRTLITANEKHYIPFLQTSYSHYGLISIPAHALRDDQFNYIYSAYTFSQSSNTIAYGMQNCMLRIGMRFEIEVDIVTSAG